jgi:hypothetical protein
MRTIIFWDITPCSTLKANRRFAATCRLHLQGRRISQAKKSVKAGGEQGQAQLCLPPATWFLVWLILRPWTWRRHAAPKRRLIPNELHGVISQKTVLFITTAVRTSNPKYTVREVFQRWRRNPSVEVAENFKFRDNHTEQIPLSLQAAYKIQTVQALKLDRPYRKEFALEMVKRINSDIITLDFPFNDESTFHLLGKDSTVDIATGYGLDGRGFRARVPVRVSVFSSPRRPNRGPSSSYSLGTDGSFPGGKAAGAWSCSLTCNWCRRQEYVIYTSTPPYVFMV